LPRRASCTNDLFQDFSIRKKMVENQAGSKPCCRTGRQGPFRRQVLPWNKIESKVEKGGYHISRLSLHSSPEYYSGIRNTKRHVILGLNTRTLLCQNKVTHCCSVLVFDWFFSAMRSERRSWGTGRIKQGPGPSLPKQYICSGI
jgi:hypothetical protein